MDNHTEVDDLNSQLVLKFIPLIIIYIIYIVTAVVANSIIIFVFPKLKHSEGRFFIPYLAGINLTGGIIGSYFASTLLFYRVNFYSVVLCKIGWFLVCMVQTYGALLLVIIATHHYLQVCQPYDGQMTLKWKRFALILGFAIAVIAATPLVFQYTVVKSVYENSGLTVSRCLRSSSFSATGDTIYSSALMFAGCFNMVTIFVLYGLIARSIRRYSLRKERKAPLHVATTNVKSKVEKTGPSEILVDYNISESSRTYYIEDGEIKMIENTNKSGNKKILRYKRRKHSMVHIIKMFIFIALNYLLTLMPSAIIVVIQSQDPEFWDNLSDSAEVGFTFFSTLYVAHNVINPFIFGFMDGEIRLQTKKIFLCRP